MLTWIRSFLYGCTQQICYAGRLSFVMQLVYDVPQGSVLGPLLFLLYTAELFDVIARSRLTDHSYTDDTQCAGSSIRAFVECVERVDAWMSSNQLRMNADKMQLIWLGT